MPSAITLPRRATASRRPFPAYGRQIADLRKQGMRPAGESVFVRLDTWPPRKRPAHLRFPQVVVSDEAEPAALSFAFLDDLDVLVAHWRSKSEPRRLRDLLREILTANPRRLIVLDVEHEKHWWVKSVDRGVEVSL